MEAFPLLTVIYYNLIYVCVKQAWLYNVSCIKPRDFNCCIVIFVTLINIKKKKNIYIYIYSQNLDKDML